MAVSLHPSFVQAPPIGDSLDMAEARFDQPCRLSK